MRTNSWGLLSIILLTTGSAGAQPIPREQGVFLGPEVGANILTLGWDPSPPYDAAVSYLPGVRAGLFLPKLFVAGHAGLSASGSPAGGYWTGSFDVGGLAAPYLWSQGNMRAYALGGLDVGTVLSANPSSGYVLPLVDVTIGAGLHSFLTPDLSIGAEAGLRTHLLFGGPVLEVSTSLFVAVTGTWSVPGAPPPGPTKGATGEPNPPTGPETPQVPAETPSSTTPTTPVYGHSSVSCVTYVTDGWFEPTQGVWQDDLSFDDKVGKQLTRVEGDGVAYRAELRMALHKDTLLFGVHHYRKQGEQVIVDSRDYIVLKGQTNCTTPFPVKFRFSRKTVAGTSYLYTSPVVAQVPLEGAPAPRLQPWEARLPVRDGVPVGQPFQFELDLPYQLEAALIREDGRPTGLSMTVDGYTEPTMGPKVHFVPVLLSATSAADEEGLIAATERLAEESGRKIPDVFPIAKDGLPTFVNVIRNFSEQNIGDKWFEFRRIDATVAALNDTLAATTFLEGAGRVVAVMSGKDFKSIFGPGAAGMTVDTGVALKPKGPNAAKYKSGLTLSWKVMLVPSYEGWDTVAHELLHTLPEGWAEDEMKKECGKAYHNDDAPVAHGERITTDGVPGPRERQVAKISLMGPSEPRDLIWIDQCTYWHLVKELAGGPPDPPVRVVRAILGKQGTKLKGELKPLYDLMGSSDLQAAKSGPFAFVFRDAKGAELARFPFTPRWNDIETKSPRGLVSVAYRVPEVPGWSRVELVGPSGVLDTRTLSAAPPTLEIRSPADLATVTPVNGKIHVTWTATASVAGAPLLYSVLYSPDGGKNWLNQSFEQKDTAFDVIPSPKGSDPQVKVIATDGTRSAEAVLRIALPKQ